MLALSEMPFTHTPNPPRIKRLGELRMRDPFIYTDKDRNLYFL